MSNLSTSTKAEVLRIVFYQLMIIMGFSLLMLLIKGLHSGLSILAGSMSYWLPTFIFMWRTSSQAGAQAAKRFIAVFFVGEVVKLFLCGVLFVISIKYLHAKLIYSIIGLIGAIIAFWIASIGMVFQTRVKL